MKTEGDIVKQLNNVNTELARLTALRDTLMWVLEPTPAVPYPLVAEQPELNFEEATFNGA